MFLFQGGLPESEVALRRGGRQAANQRADRQFGERNQLAQVSWISILEFSVLAGPDVSIFIPEMGIVTLSGNIGEL